MSTVDFRGRLDTILNPEQFFVLSKKKKLKSAATMVVELAFRVYSLLV